MDIGEFLFGYQAPTFDINQAYRRVLGDNRLNSWGVTGLMYGEDAMQAALGLRGRTGSALDMLEKAARGEAPSAAESLLMRGTERARAGVQSMLAGMRGVNPLTAYRIAQQQQAQLGAQAAQEAAALRAQEMAQARAQYMQGLLGARGLESELAAKFMAMGLSADQAAAQARLALEQLAVQQQLGKQHPGFLGGLLGTAGTVATLGLLA